MKNLTFHIRIVFLLNSRVCPPFRKRRQAPSITLAVYSISRKTRLTSVKDVFRPSPMTGDEQTAISETSAAKTQTRRSPTNAHCPGS